MITIAAGRNFVVLGAVFALSSWTGAALPVQSDKAPGPLAAVLDYPNISEFLWSGNDKLVIRSRRQFRRGDVQLVGLSADFKQEYLPQPRDLPRFGFGVQNAGISASPDGRWLIGSDIRGTRAIDLVSGDVQSWPGDVRSGFWLPDSSAWIEAAHLKTSTDQFAQDRLERELNAKTMELRLFEVFGDEWPNSPSRRQGFSLAFEAVVLAASGKDELVIASQQPPSSKDITLTWKRIGKATRPVRSVVLRCPKGGSICDVAIAPDGKTVAYLTVRPDVPGVRDALPGDRRDSIRTDPDEQDLVAELWTTSLDRAGHARIFPRTEAEVAEARVENDALGVAMGRPRSLRWKPNGKMLGFVQNDQILLLTAP